MSAKLPRNTSYFFRALIPSWRFFDDVGQISKLYYQVDSSSIWHSCFTKKDRRWTQLFLNSQGNLRLALHAAIERLILDISDLSLDAQGASHLIPQSASYHLVENLVRHQARSAFPEAQIFRFKILVSSPEEKTSYEALVSAEHEVTK